MSDYVQAGYLGKVVLHESCFPEVINPEIGNAGVICSDGTTIQTSTGLQFPNTLEFVRAQYEVTNLPSIPRMGSGFVYFEK